MVGGEAWALVRRGGGARRACQLRQAAGGGGAWGGTGEGREKRERELRGVAGRDGLLYRGRAAEREGCLGLLRTDRDRTGCECHPRGGFLSGPPPRRLLAPAAAARDPPRVQIRVVSDALTLASAKAPAMLCPSHSFQRPRRRLPLHFPPSLRNAFPRTAPPLPFNRPASNVSCHSPCPGPVRRARALGLASPAAMASDHPRSHAHSRISHHPPPSRSSSWRSPQPRISGGGSYPPAFLFVFDRSQDAPTKVSLVPTDHMTYPRRAPSRMPGADGGGDASIFDASCKNFNARARRLLPLLGSKLTRRGGGAWSTSRIPSGRTKPFRAPSCAASLATRSRTLANPIPGGSP